MAWFRIDDQAAFHAKIATAGNAAVGALWRAGAWSSGHLTEGLVPRAIALAIAPKGTWDRLVAVGLLHREGEDFRIHDYLDWNPSADEVRTERARKAANVAAHRARKRSNADDVAEPVTDRVTAPVTGNEATEKSTRNHGPIPIPRSLTHTPSAREGGPDEPPASASRPSPTPDPAPLAKAPAELASPEARRILAAIRGHETLAPAATPKLAMAIEGRAMARGTPVEVLIEAIGECARDAATQAAVDATWDVARIADQLGRYCDSAGRRHRATPAQGTRVRGASVAGNGTPPVQPQAKPGEYDWRKGAEEKRAAKLRELEVFAAAAAGGG